MSPALILIGFLAGAVLVVLAGVRLARAGDVIAARTRLGGVWVGSVFLAIATSLPELATDVAAIRLGALDLAAGDIFGSSMANMLILALVGLVPGVEIFRRAALDNALAAALAITLTAVAAIFMLLRVPTSWLGLGVGSFVLAVGYFAGIRTVFHSSTLARRAGEVVETAARPTAPTAHAEPEKPPLRRAIGAFILAALVILVSAPVFAASAKGLADLTGLGTSFVGTWLVGFATSLPELVTSLAAVRMRAYDLAAGNLFGSNAVNMVMFVPLDLAHGRGPILASVSEVHAISALVAIILMAIGIAALAYRSTARFRVFEPSSALMILVYVAGLGLVYLHR